MANNLLCLVKGTLPETDCLEEVVGWNMEDNAASLVDAGFRIDLIRKAQLWQSEERWFGHGFDKSAVRVCLSFIELKNILIERVTF